MTRLLLPLLLLAGCASAVAPEEDPERVVRFVVVPAPSVGGEEEVPGGDLLLEVVTQLSAETALDFCLVPGPLLAAEPGEDAIDELIGGLGSFAPRVYPAFAAEEVDQGAVLEAFEETLPGHDGKPQQKGKRVGPLKPVTLDPATDPRPGILVRNAAGARIYVQSGEEVLFERQGDEARLVLPPLVRPPHLYALCTYTSGELSIQLVSALELPVSLAPPSVTLR